MCSHVQVHAHNKPLPIYRASDRSVVVHYGFKPREGVAGNETGAFYSSVHGRKQYKTVIASNYQEL